MKCTSHEIDKPNLKMINFQREDDVYAWSDNLGSYFKLRVQSL